MTRGRGIERYVFALGMTALAGLVVGAVRPERVSFPKAARSFDFHLAPGAGHLQIGVRSDQSKPSQLTVVLEGRQASFLHRPGRTEIYRLQLGAVDDVARRIRINVDPPAEVARVPSTGRRPHRPRLEWRSAGPPLVLPPPRSASRNQPTAEASVDESDTYGLRLFGVPIRTAARVDASLVTTASHGDRLEATCWTIGDVLTNGFPENPRGAYSSDVWFKVLTDHGPGFVPDVRFARRGGSDRLNLPACGSER